MLQDTIAKMITLMCTATDVCISDEAPALRSLARLSSCHALLDTMEEAQ